MTQLPTKHVEWFQNHECVPKYLNRFILHVASIRSGYKAVNMQPQYVGNISFLPPQGSCVSQFAVHVSMNTMYTCQCQFVFNPKIKKKKTLVGGFFVELKRLHH